MQHIRSHSSWICISTCSALMFIVTMSVQHSGASLNGSIEDDAHHRNMQSCGITRTYVQMFYGMEDEDLAKMIRSNVPHLALSAAWERVRRELPNVNEVPAEQLIDTGTIDRFLGVVEGRLRVTIPEWWEENLRTARVNNVRRACFPWREDIMYPYQRTGQFLAPPGTHIEVDGDNAVLFHDAIELLLPDDMWKANTHPKQSVNVICEAERCFVAIHWPLGTPYPLFCVNHITGEVVWSARVWCSDTSTLMGPDQHWTTLQRAGPDIIVFGMSSIAAYIEVFDATTGKPRVRFNTSDVVVVDSKLRKEIDGG